jgi:molybdate transport system permease protein
VTPLTLSVVVAVGATVLLLPPGLLAAWWLGCGRPFPGKAVVETLLTLPLVLPPTAVGYALLLALGRGSAMGVWLNDRLGIHLLFTWEGAAIAAAVMGAPLFVRTAASAFAAVDPDLIDAGRTLGADDATLFVRVRVPLAYRGLIAGLSLAFARALGEFGATLLVAGNIPGRTQTLPLALYDAVQSGDAATANRTALLLTAIAFVLVSTVGALTGRVATRRGENR